MHELLNASQRARRARRRLGEIETWRVAETQTLGPWRFDGAPIAISDPWPRTDGVRGITCPSFEVPADWPLQDTLLALDVGGEALLAIVTDGGRRTLGLDAQHQEFVLETREGCLEIEAVARSAYGQAVADPRLSLAELRRVEPALIAFARTARLAIDLARALNTRESEHELSALLLEAVENAMARLDWPTRSELVLSRQSAFARGYGGRDAETRSWPAVPLNQAARSSLDEALTWLTGELRALKTRFPPHGAVAYVGHAHLDTAWLWPIEETRRKARRTFSTAVELLKRNPDFRFAQSFAEYYRYLEDDDPALLDQIRTLTAQGRWAPAGGLWVEPDINMPCGESLVRQALYGQLHFERTFGRRHTAAMMPLTGRSEAAAAVATQFSMIVPGHSGMPRGGASQLGSRVFAASTATKRRGC